MSKEKNNNYYEDRINGLLENSVNPKEKPKKESVREKERNRKQSIKSTRKIYTILEFIFVIIIIYSLVNILIWYKDNKASQTLLAGVSNSVTIDEITDREAKPGAKRYVVDFDYLQDQNPDTVGWLKVLGTEIEYPVVQGYDNDYYLTHSFDKSYNSAGWPFAHYKDKCDGTDKNVIVFGHNRRDGSMFGTLQRVLWAEWCDVEENRKVIYVTKYGDYEYQVFSTYQILSEDYYMTTNFSSDEEYLGFLNTLKGRSIKDFGVEVTAQDKILTLSTCGNNNKYRTVLHAKKIVEETPSQNNEEKQE